jgi:hypothetical protein
MGTLCLRRIVPSALPFPITTCADDPMNGWPDPSAASARFALKRASEYAITPPTDRHPDGR